uniref:putative disease resistance protein At4g19050 n=1 Tax=Erigeron canadensis TaxID=72917 RepID=UPI001CB8F30E|nr:putative disease resistance protein At4g19050 [Erigeron canadensis]
MADTQDSSQSSSTIMQKDKGSMNIYETLIMEDKSSNPVMNIYGSSGVGKTSLAKKLSERAMREDAFSFTLWVFIYIEYTKESLSRSIARQLFLLPSTDEEWEDEDSKNEDEGNGKVQKDEDTSNARKKENTEEIVEKIKEKLKGTRVLLILDGDKGNVVKFWSIWEEMLPNVNLKKVFISRLKRSGKDFTEKNTFEVKALPNAEASNSVLIEKLDPRLKNLDAIKDKGRKFIEKVEVYVPGRITMLAKALNYFDGVPSGVSILEKELEEASKKYNVSRLLCLMHNALPRGVLKELWWRGHHFFRDSGSVHYSELITYWILEGYLGSDTMTKLYKKGHGILMMLMDCGVLKGQEGGYVFMDNSLINIDDLYQYQHVHQTASLGLATFFVSDVDSFGRVTHKDGMLKTPRTRKKQSLKESVQNLQESSKESDPDHPQSSKESGPDHPQPPSNDSGQNLTTLLLDGIHFTEQEMLDFLKPEKKLQVLALFNTTIKSLPESLKEMAGLRVLVLRGCEFLQDLKFSVHLDMHNLNALEISSARSMRYLKSGFFKNMLNLKSLHLSGLQITKLPQAIYNLEKLQWLIIKDCPRLKKLESISKLVNLLVVDLSGNLLLDSVDKNFLKFNKLQILNLSQTLVSTTPLLRNIGHLTHLLCRECKGLGRLRGLTSLTSLQTIDLTDSKEFDEFHDSSLQSLSSLQTLNLSGTFIDRLPSNISKPCLLYLKNCLQLKRLSCLQSLEKLEELDLSGSKNLFEIEDKFFDHTKSLRILNLSETKIERLPSLSNLSNLRELFLSCCKSLKHLPSLESSIKLEIIDVSKCCALEKIENKSFGSMTRLQKLDFSGTQITSFPDLPNPCQYLHHLLLKGCTKLEGLQLNASFPKLRELDLSGITSLKNAEFVTDITTLQILDISNTSLEKLPSIAKLTNLTYLSLSDCPFKETELHLNGSHSKLEVLDISRTSINQLPKNMNFEKLQKLLLKDCSMVDNFRDVKLYDPKTYDISGFGHLNYLEFPNIKVESKSEHPWKICLLSDNDKPRVFVNGDHFLEHLENDSWPVGPNHLCAIPGKMEGETEVQRHELVFADVYLETSSFLNYKESKSLQIRGFDHFQNSTEAIIKEVDLFFLLDYKLKDSPFDHTSIFSNLKGCWIERCHEMVNIFHNKEAKNDNLDSGIPLENLGIVNNRHLVNIFEGKQPFGRFNVLKSLYLDTCPNITTVFPSSWLPNNLETLQIKNCDKLVSIFDPEVTLPKLETLILWELPECENVGILPLPVSLQTLKVCECPKLVIETDFHIPRGLKTLWISGAATLENLHTVNDESVDLETLKLEHCLKLEYIVSKSSILAKCKMMEIKSCKKLGVLSQDLDYSMPNFGKILLVDLPMLKSLRINSSIQVEHYECPNLEIQRID